MTKQSDTALLIFSRLPKKEAGFKQLFGKDIINELLHDQLYRHTVSLGESPGLPLIKFTEKHQRGNTFAEKISGAMAAVFAEGFENIIVIGSDCPGLKRKHIKIAQQDLASGKKIVAGADKRGGIYLLGINKSAFKKEAFLHFSWQTAFLFSEIKNYASAFTHSVLSDVLRDVNTSKDVLVTSVSFSSNPSWRNIVAQYFYLPQLFLNKYFYFNNGRLPVMQLAFRGPPSR